MVYVLMFMLLFQVSGAALNTLHLFTNPGGIGSGAAGYLSNVAQQNSCQSYTIGANAGSCTPSIGGTASILQNILIFGDWFGGLVILTITFGWSLINPWGFLGMFGVPGVIILVMSAAQNVGWLFLGLWIRTGRTL
jgi:hypothetical protein